MHIVIYHVLLMINIYLMVNKLVLVKLIIIDDWILYVIKDLMFDLNLVMSQLEGFNGIRVGVWFYWVDFMVF